MDFYRYWAKTNHDQSEWHLLPYHSLDVAACGKALLEVHPKMLARVATALKLTPEEAEGFLLHLLALHDFGKFLPHFQMLAPKVVAALGQPERTHVPYVIRHDTAGYIWWSLDNSRELNALACAIFGHHGVPPLILDEPGLFDDEELEDAQALSDAFAEIFKPGTPERSAATEEFAKELSWTVAGWAVLADWLGSNVEAFPFVAERVPLTQYWDMTQKAAGKLVKDAGLERPVPSGQDFEQLFPRYAPSALQTWANTVEIPEEPALFILEDATGAGKTEAAFTLASRIMAARDFGGVFVGLPTTATANQMYDRTSDVYRAMFVEGGMPSLVLAHGQRKLSEKFRQTLEFNTPNEPKSYDRKGNDVTASAFCAAWLADRAKKSLLAHVGVGTIDQLLLGVLPAKHQSLRMWGIRDKVIIVDEVHAYDEYMNELLLTVLRFCRQEGLYVVLLSATLSDGLKAKFLSTYTGDEAIDARFPLAMVATENRLTESAIQADPGRERKLEVLRLESDEEGIEKVRTLAKSGRCVCWIRNTVNDAVAVYHELEQEFGDHVDLFHARFAAADRQTIEQRVVTRFGKDSQADARRGRIVIATQVVEQSLDVDFDEIVTDLAPVDLLIQRAGRMRRHKRDGDGNPIPHDLQDQRGPIRLHIVSPDPGSVDSATWLADVLPGSNAVYQRLDVMWRTAKVIFSSHEIALPGDSRALVSAVYDSDDCPDALAERADRGLGKGLSKQNQGRLNALTLTDGYQRFGQNFWQDEHKTPTRIEEVPSTKVRLAVWDGAAIAPIAKADRFAWELSEVSMAVHLFGESTTPELDERAKALMPDEGRWVDVLVLTPGPDGLVAQRAAKTPFTLLYDSKRGLQKLEDR
ncbi:MAG: CRISPR-associated helicase Cas3' [bacterium]